MKFSFPRAHQHRHQHGRNNHQRDRCLPQVSLEAGFPLSEVQLGQCVQLVGVRDQRIKRLLNKGLSPGETLKVLNVRESGSVLVAMGERHLSIGAGLAQDLIVSIVVTAAESVQEVENKTFLNELSVGAKGKVVSYTQGAKGYKGKLLSMGLTPGAHFTVTRIAPLGDPIAITVRGFHLSLRRQEAAGLVVEQVEPSRIEPND